MRRNLLALLACISVITAKSQTLFTYGGVPVDAREFLRAYNKNNTEVKGNRAQALRNYLDLYINSRLKIHEAYVRRYDTADQFVNDVSNLRAQIIENFMNDPQTKEKLFQQAFQRSLKDIHVAHIFIAARMTDTITAYNKLNELLSRLKKEEFSKLAVEFSEDPSAKINKGDLGWVTVFTLPYDFENIIYATPVGSFSAPYRSKAGYHVFKNLGERKAVGKMKARQILLAIPPGAGENEKKQIARRADSLYKRILAGVEFEKLARELSDDYVSAATGGNLPEISVGQYDAVFENAVWALTRDGAVSKPFLTSHGWHIVKRVSVKPVITDPRHIPNQQELQQKITTDGRWKAARHFIYEKVKKDPGLKMQAYDPIALRAFSDSLLEGKPMGSGRSISRETILFTIGKSNYTAGDWINYATAFRFKSDGTGAKPSEQVMEDFINQSLYNYYSDHLEDYNEEFKNQMQEFKDGNLFFEIMQQEVWNRAQNDSVALISLYEKNMSIYTWKQSADVIAFFCSDLTTAKTVLEQMKKRPADWRKIAEAQAEKLAADSSRYEWDQIPGWDKKTPKAGQLTTPVINELDNTASFAYIVRVYDQPTQRSFTEARGLLINDYQAILEKAWLESLKKKYPVVIDQAVLEQISK